MSNFQQRLAQLRKDHKMTQKELAEFLGVNTRTVQYYESGAKRPGFDAIGKLAEVFSVSTDYLLGYVDDPRMVQNEGGQLGFHFTGHVSEKLNIHDRLQWLRDINGLSEHQVAQATGISVLLYRQLENGSEALSIDLVRQFARLYNVDVEPLLNGMNTGFSPMRFRKARERAKLSCEDAARMINLDSNTYLRFEYGDETPTSDQLSVLALKFDTSMEFLMGFTSDMRSRPALELPGVRGDQGRNEAEVEQEFLRWVEENLESSFFYDFSKSPEDSKREMMRGLRLVWELEKGRKPGQKQGEP